MSVRSTNTELIPDPSILPHLVQLVDDDSPVVREAVASELAAFGPGLDALLDHVMPPPNATQRQHIDALLQEHNRRWLREHWSKWYTMEGEFDRLETALGFLAAYQSYPAPRIDLKTLLDTLAEDFAEHYPEYAYEGLAILPEDADPADAAVALAEFLFGEGGLQGARDNYYHPQNSNLVYVVQAGEGIPISLACVYLLVGHRLGLPIAGCNWPGHFLARIDAQVCYLVVDCYHHGRCHEEETFLRMQGPSRRAAQRVLYNAADTETIVARVLANLIQAYHSTEDWPSRRLMIELLNDLHRHQHAQRQQ